MKLEEIAENHGLTPEGVDYALTQYQIVICEITHGIMSKLSYDAKDIIRTAQERWCDTCDLKEQEAVEPKEIVNEHYPIGDYRRTIGWLCGKCGETIMGDANYCSYCGREIKWE